MKKILIGVSAAAVALCGYSATPVKPKVTNVSISKASMQVVPETVSAYGHMQAIHQVSLSFEASGHINKIYKRSGRVKEHELIMTLNDDVDQAQLKADQATLKLDQSNYQRSLKLKVFGGVSAAALEGAKAKVNKDEAVVEGQQALINKKKLLAPFAGVLGDLKFSKGAYINAGQNVMSLVQEAPLKVRYSLPGRYKTQLEIGQAATVYQDSKSYKGLVNFISPQVNTDSGTLTIEAKVTNKDYALTPGEFVNVIQILNPNRKLLVIPSVAVMSDILGQYVFVIKDNVAEKVYLKTGIVSKSDIQVKKGLKLGDEVVVAGQQKIFDGYKVKIVPGPNQLPSAKKPKLEVNQIQEAHK